MSNTEELRRKLRSDDLIDHIDIHANVKPVLIELINRLEAAEKERDWNAEQLEAAIEECTALRAKVSDLAINVEYLGNLKKSYEELIGELQDGRDALRAKIEAMARQEPVAWGAFYFGGKLNGKLYSHCDTEAQIDKYIVDRHQSDDRNTFRKAALYALPGAKGE